MTCAKCGEDLEEDGALTPEGDCAMCENRGKNDEPVPVVEGVLKSCPFCGAEAKGFEIAQADGSKQSFIVCDLCRGAGPLKATPREAMEAWNKRIVDVEVLPRVGQA